MLDLTNEQWIGFSIYLGFKSSARDYEFETRGVDRADTEAALTRVGVIRNGRMIPRKQAYELFDQKFPGQIASQTHQVMGKLGYKTLNVKRG